MKMTSAQVNKLIRQLSDELKAIEARETNTRSFVAATSENIESVRPEYDYAATQTAIIELENKIRKAKHALNVFNAATVIPEFDMTIDMMLVYLPQLTHRRNRLARMKDVLPKVRENKYDASFIDYRYANYDIDKANEDYLAADAELTRAQITLDLVNSTVEFELDI